ncbi:MAG: hypothetical protein ACRD11_01665 [Terriglobia bacterium]
MVTTGTTGQNSKTSSTQPPAAAPAQHGSISVSTSRQEDAIYQKNRVVASVLDPQIDLEAGVIQFGEIHNSDDLLLPDECEFRQHRIMVRKIGYATKVERHSLEKGRILQNVKAEILGDRQQ